MKSSEKIFENIVEMNPEINMNIFSQTKFKKNYIEDLFLNDNKEASFLQNILGDLMLLLGYLANLIYIYLAYYRKLIFLYCIIIMLFTFILIVISFKIQNKRLKKFINQLEVFLISFFMNTKVFIICFYYNTLENDNGEEILRVIIYDYISTNLFILVKLEGGIAINLFYFTFNAISVLVGHFHSLTNHFFLLEIITSFIISIIFYSFRKIWAFKIRYIFAEKYKYQNLYSYTYDFLNGFNGFHINFKNKMFIDCNKKFSNFLNDFIEINKENNSNTEDNSRNEKNNLISNNLNLFSRDVQNKKNIKIILKEKDSIDIFLDSLIEIDYCHIINLKLDKNDNIKNYSLNNLIKKLFKDENNFDRNLFLGIFGLVKIKNKLSENNNFSLNANIEDSNITLKDLNLKKNNCYFDVFFRKIKFYGDIIIYNIILYDISELILTKKIYEDEIKIKQKIFSKIENEFYNPLKKISSNISELNNKIIKLELVNMKNLIDKKQKDKLYLSKIEILKDIESINNISQYVVFLLNDILQVTKKANYNDLFIENQNITNIVGVAEFCFKILEILISFDEKKQNKIQPLLNFENSKLDLKRINICTDMTKIKQIIINFITNAVKYTERGKISITCRVLQEKNDYDNRLIISIKDSGVGMKLEDSQKLLTYFNTKENFDSNEISPRNFEKFNHGIGMLNCKNILEKLDLKMKFSSKLGEGSEFCLILPLFDDTKKKIIFDKNKLNNYFDEDNVQINFSKNDEINLKSEKSNKKIKVFKSIKNIF